MHRFLGLLVLTLVVGLVPAMADLQPVGDPLALGSWGQRFIADTGTYNAIEIEWVSGFGGGFKLPAISNFSDSSWALTANTAKLAAASGPQHTKDLQFDIDFVANSNVPGVFEFWATMNGTKVDSAVASWNGGAWSFGALNEQPPTIPTPEPTVMLLLGMMGTLGLGVPKLLKRR